MDTSEKGLESLIVTAMTGRPWPEPAPGSVMGEAPAAAYRGTGWLNDRPEDYVREWCVDPRQLAAFLWATQPKQAKALDLANDSSIRR